MKPVITNVAQRSPEWHQLRLGKATASRFKDILATIRSGEAAQRRNYKAELVVERLTGEPVKREANAFMQWGTETEDLARLMYSLKTRHVVDEAGFYTHPELAAGASPDGLIAESGLIEIKCRQIASHIQSLKEGVVLPEYLPQIQGQLWLTNREWCDFVSFVPELPQNAQLFIQRVWRDEDYISNLAQAVENFLEEVEADAAFVRGYNL